MGYPLSVMYSERLSLFKIFHIIKMKNPKIYILENFNPRAEQKLGSQLTGGIIFYLHFSVPPTFSPPSMGNPAAENFTIRDFYSGGERIWRGNFYETEGNFNVGEGCYDIEKGKLR